MKTELDWSGYDSYGEGDAYAALPATGGGFGKAASVCIGSRQCQRDAAGVMCPSFRVTHDTRHSTQHRAATLKAALNGELGAKPFSSPELDAAMDLCVACKGCKRECPNGTDMALLRSETLAQRWRETGQVPLRTRLLASVPRWIGYTSWLRGLIRLRQQLPVLARIAERVTGIAAGRSLPLTAATSFLASEQRSLIGAGEGREVALWIDTFSNHLEPENAEAALELLLSGGYRVHMVRAPEGEAPLCCGRTWFSSGLIDRARQEAVRVVDALWPLVERGIPVIGLEPSCLLMLRDEYLSLELGDKAARIAKAALLLEEFIAREHDGKRLQLKFASAQGERLVVHGHCHQKAFGAMKSLRKTLSLIPELEVDIIESSCCGMAGSFGFEAEHFETSMQMAELSLLPRLREEPADARILANGTSCRHQIRDGAKRDSVHLARVLRDSLLRP